MLPGNKRHPTTAWHFVENLPVCHWFLHMLSKTLISQKKKHVLNQTLHNCPSGQLTVLALNQPDHDYVAVSV